MLVDLELEELTPLLHKVVDSYKPKNQQQREELFSVALEGAWMAFENYNKNKSKFKTFLYNNIRWKILSYFKQEKKRDHPYESLEEEIQDNSSQNIVNDFNRHLSKFEQSILKYRIQGYTYREIKDMTGKNPSLLQKTMLDVKKKYIQYEKN